MNSFDQQVAAAKQWFASPRFAGIVRLCSPRDVAEQQGTILHEYSVARHAAEEFYKRLRELFEQHRPMTTFGPYSPARR
jgi:isocitrate lyase